MAYTKNPTWVDGEAGGTLITAATLNHIEDGIEAAAAGAGPIASGVAPLIWPTPGLWYLGTDQNLAGGKSVTTEHMFHPITFGKTVTVDQIGIYISTAVSGATVALGICAARTGGFWPGVLLVNGGTINASTTGQKAVTGLSQILQPGTLYWLVYTASVAGVAGWGTASAIGAGFDYGRVSFDAPTNSAYMTSTNGVLLADYSTVNISSSVSSNTYARPLVHLSEVS